MSTKKPTLNLPVFFWIDGRKPTRKDLEKVARVLKVRRKRERRKKQKGEK